jgi:hypothetical protein
MVEDLKDTVSLPFMIHYYYSVADLGAFMQLLDGLNIPYFSGPDRKRGIRTREDGVKQLFIKDPDMYWVEVNDAKH